MPNAREIAHDINRRVNDEGAFLGLLLRYGLEKSGLNSRDRALVSELVYGMQRYRGKLDYVISVFSKKSLECIDPEILDLLRLGIYQITEMRVPDHASVNETVKLAKSRLHPGAASFVNAILRAAAAGFEEITWPGREDFASYLETVLSYPRWLVEYLLNHFEKDEAEKLCEASNAFSGFTLRVNLSRIDRASLLENIRREGGRAELSPYLEEALTNANLPWDELGRLLKQGLCVVQDQSSMLVSHVVQPSSARTIIDCCAAPGGKAVHMAQLGGNACRVIALDASVSRLEALRNAIVRLGAENVDVLEGDATHLEEYVEEPADAILVDAPCSGLGSLRRRPELKWRKTIADLKTMANLQLALLEGSSAMVRAGGALIYSVCTFTREETLEVMEAFLGRHPDYHAENLAAYIPPGLRTGVSRDGFIQLMPHIHDMDAMFIARLIRY